MSNSHDFYDVWFFYIPGGGFLARFRTNHQQYPLPFGSFESMMFVQGGTCDRSLEGIYWGLGEDITP